MAKDVYAAIESAAARTKTGKPAGVGELIDLYSHGLIAKLKEAEYALSRLRELAPKAGPVVEEQVPFYVDAFFAFIYSAFDVLGEVVNQTQSLGLSERDASFKSVLSELTTNAPATPLSAQIATLRNHKHFKKLDEYRNCSTHRRQIYIRREEVTVSGTPGYALTGAVTTVERFICTNPLNTKPKIDKRRRLVPYCEQMLKWVKTEIRKLTTAY